MTCRKLFCCPATDHLKWLMVTLAFNGIWGMSKCVYGWLKEQVKMLKLFLWLTNNHYAMKMYGGMDAQIHIFFTKTLNGAGWSDSHSSHFTPGETAPSIHWIRGLVDPRTSVDNMENWKFLLGLELKIVTCYNNEIMKWKGLSWKTYCHWLPEEPDRSRLPNNKYSLIIQWLKSCRI
jgi:hypothetical protein